MSTFVCLLNSLNSAWTRKGNRELMAALWVTWVEKTG